MIALYLAGVNQQSWVRGITLGYSSSHFGVEYLKAFFRGAPDKSLLQEFCVLDVKMRSCVYIMRA